MCGICGTIGYTDRALLENMTAILTHRGPDDGGTFIAPGVAGLGARRLSILDLSPAGHMPMANEDGTVHVTYNGEIYNFQELREELIGRGHRFRSKTDTEVLVHGYEEWGTGLLARINGMFAFALLDQRKRGDPSVLLARDRYGIKPLYYTCLGDDIVFASEIKAILLARGVKREIHPDALHRYLAFFWVPGPETMFQGIEKLAPGHFLEWKRGRHSLQRYWDLKFEPDESAREEDLVERVRGILRRSVERHLISDVPVGVFLSGGIDSTALLGLATQITGKPVPAYTIAYREQDGKLEQSADDAKFARIAARHYGAAHHEFIVQPDLVSVLPKVAWHLDEPVADPAAIATLLICEAARPELKVLLSGQGADEIFAGYRLHWTNGLANWARYVPEGPAHAFLRWIPRLQNSVPGISPGFIMAGHRYAGRLLKGSSLSPEQRYIFNRSYFTDAEQLALYTPEFRETVKTPIAGSRHLEHFAAAAGADFLNRMLYVDVKTFLPELNLTYCDKLSSAASIETRVPFLDNELVDCLANVPPRLKLKGLTSKYILKRALAGTVPERIVRRRKAPFAMPIRGWLRNELREMVDSLLSERSLAERGIFRPAAIRSLIEADRNGTGDSSYRIWALLNLEIWMRTFLDQPVAEPMAATGAIH